MTGAEIEQLIAEIPAMGMSLVAIGASAFPGVPEEAFLLVIGYMIGTGVAPFWSTLLFLIVGFFMVDCFLFSLARRDFRLVRVIQKKLLGVSDVSSDGFVSRNIERIVFASRFAVYIRWVGPLLAGRVRMSWGKFMVVDMLALCIYVPAMLGLGIYFRARIDRVVAGVNAVGNIVGVALVMMLIIAVVAWGTRRFRLRLRDGAVGELDEVRMLGFRFRKKTDGDPKGN